MKKSTVFVINLLLLITIIFIPINTYASTQVKTWDQLKQDADAFINKGRQSDVINSGTVANTIMPIAQALVAFASVVLVAVTCIMGVKYATSGTSSPEERAKLKKQLVGLVVSIIVVFGAQAIWAILYNFLKDF